MECGVKRLLVGLDFVYLRNICLFGYILQTFVLLCLGLCVRGLEYFVKRLCRRVYILSESWEYFVKRLSLGFGFLYSRFGNVSETFV